MLRITIHEDDQACRLELAGRLVGPWVAETENAWQALLRSGRKIEVDLRQLMGLDQAGRQLLAAIQRAGACLIVEGVWLTALLEEIISEQSSGGAKPQSLAENHRRRSTSRQQEKK